MKTDHKIKLYDQVMTVNGDYQAEHPASPDGLTPSVSARFDIDEIIWHKQNGNNVIDIDVTDLITCFPDYIIELEDQCLKEI